MEKVKAVVLNDTMGDYHHFRLICANDSLHCKAIQFSSIDHTNFWDASKEKNKNIFTLFNHKPITEIDKFKIKKRLFEVLDDINPEVVILSGWDAVPSLLALSWAINNNKPTVIVSESQKHDFKRKLPKEFLKRLLLKLIDTAFVGGINQRLYLMELGFEDHRIFEGCDIVDNEFFILESKPEDIKNLNLPNQFFLTSCRFVEKKNLRTLIDAFSEISHAHPDWSLVLAGDGPLKEDLKSLTIKRDVSDKVYFPGYLDYIEMKHAYAAASCFVLPSTTEQWGLVINEALASGLPVICSENVGSAPNLLSNQHVGYMFDPFSSKDLENKMMTIIKEIKTIDFSINAKSVISEWGRDKYSKNIQLASAKAIEIYERKGILKRFFLKLFIYLLK